MNPTDAPCARTFHGIAYDSDNKVVVLFGGVDNGGNLLGDTWTYNVKTNTWTNMNPTDAPYPRHGIAMAYDSKNKKVVLIGDKPWAGWVTETWTYDVTTNTWTKMEPSSMPPSAANLEYDSANNVMVMLSYLTVSTYSLETNTWITKETPANQPSLRWHGVDAFAYDSENGLMILFSGYLWDTPPQDTWAYDVKENKWTNLNPSVMPPARGNHGLVYDSKNKVIVMFGGATTPTSGPLLGDTWIYIYRPNPKGLTQKLIETIKTWNLPNGTENSLTSKLQNAIQSLENGQQNAAINKLNAFINEVKAQRNKKLTNAQADTLITEAQRIINAIQG